jgi:hypothetical protein
MDYETYRKAYFVEPVPGPRAQFTGAFGGVLYYEDYEAAVSYYTAGLGPPGYVEGDSTRGWPIGAGWLTLLRGKSGSPTNVELTFEVATPAEAESLQQAFMAAGGQGPAPSDEFIYVPLRACFVQDPWGVDMMIVSPLPIPGT